MSPIPGIIASSQTGGLVTGAFESIASTTGSGTTVTFSSIPGTYKHLQLRCLIKGSPSTATDVVGLTIQFNSDTAANYTYHELRGDGSTVSAAGSSGTNNLLAPRAVMLSASTRANMFSVALIDIIDYASTSKFKTTRMITGADSNTTNTQYCIDLVSGLWRSTSAITSITIGNDFNQNFTSDSVFSLYGIKG